MKLFLYNEDFRMDGEMAVLHGYRLAYDPCHDHPEIIKQCGATVMGKIVEVHKSDIDMIDTYYCLGLNVYDKIHVTAVAKGGKKIQAITYRFNIEQRAL